MLKQVQQDMLLFCYPQVMPNLFRQPIMQVKFAILVHQLKLMHYQQGHVYIMTNKYRTTFYIGVTSDLRSRVYQHIRGEGEGSAFVKRYRLNDLVFYEYFERITDAIDREKQLKNWHHDWKVNLIRSQNHDMKDLKFELDLDING